MKTSTKRGFTLIELLVVIAIIGILSSIVLASLNSARKKGRDARRVADVKQLQLALELYYDAQGQYPATTTAANLVTPGYIAAIPVDPSTNVSYMYSGIDTNSSAGSCESYHLGAVLETAGHSALTSDAGAAAGTACTGASTDFAGESAACTATAGTDACYDVKP